MSTPYACFVVTNSYNSPYHITFGFDLDCVETRWNFPSFGTFGQLKRKARTEQVGDSVTVRIDAVTIQAKLWVGEEFLSNHMFDENEPQWKTCLIIYSLPYYLDIKWYKYKNSPSCWWLFHPTVQGQWSCADPEVLLLRRDPEKKCRVGIETTCSLLCLMITSDRNSMMSIKHH